MAKPKIPLHDPRFKYTCAAQTDIGKRIGAELRRLRNLGKLPSSKVVQLKQGKG